MDSHVLMRPNKSIENDDLDIILMYLENKNKSNGGNILNHEYDKSQNTLTVKYETNAAKRGVLTKKFHKLLDYLLVASEHVKSKDDLIKIVDQQNTALKTQLKSIILSNILSNEDLSILTLYAEYLVPDNEIVDVKSSKIFKNTFIIEFKEEVNFEQVSKRYLKRSSLRNQPVKLYQAFETFSYFIKNPLDLQPLNAADSFFVYIESMKVHLLINSVETIVNNPIEKFFSFEQLKDLLPEILIEIKQEPMEIKQEPTVCPPPPQNLKFIEISVENPLYIALLNCKQIFSDFDKNLNKINACLFQISEKKAFKIDYMKYEMCEEHHLWLNKVEYIIENFEKFINFAQIKLVSPSIPKNFETCISVLTKDKTDLHIYLNNSFVIMIGYENSVKYSYNVISNILQQPVQQQQQYQQPPKIDLEPLMSALFTNCGDVFSELLTLLKSENAKLGPNYANIVPIGPLAANETIWNNCVRDRFNQYILENIKLHTLQIPANKTRGFQALVDKLGSIVNKRRVYFFFDQSSFNIIGFHEDVNKMIVQMNNEMQVLDHKQITVAVANGDELFTFQIEDVLHKSLLLECKGVFEDLNIRLKSVNAQFSSGAIQTLVVQQIQKVGNESKNEWSAKVKEILQKFFQLQITVSKLDVKYFDVNLINKFKSDAKNEKTLNFVYTLNPPNEVIFCGFKKSVNKIVSFLTEASTKAPSVEQPPPLVPVVKPKVPSFTTTILHDETIDIDYYISKTLVNCPRLYSKLSQKLSGSNGVLFFNASKDKVEIVKKFKGSANSDKWVVLNRKVLNTFKSNDIKISDYPLRLVENFNESLLNKLKADLTTLRSKCKDNFMFFVDQNQTLKIVGDPSVFKEPTDFMKQFLPNMKAPSLIKLPSSTNSRSSSVVSVTSKLPVVEDFNRIVIDVVKQPKLTVLFAFNKVFLDELVKNLENTFNVRCTVDESVKKPSKANLVIHYQQSIAAAAIALDGWKPEVLKFVSNYFDRFKQVRLAISENVYSIISKNMSLITWASLKRFNRQAFEIIGVNEEVDKLINEIKILENNGAVSSFFDKF